MRTYTMDEERKKRAVDEPKDFQFVRLLMNHITGKPQLIEPAAVELDCYNAIDLVMNKRFFLAVRGRTFTNEQYSMYGDQVTLRCKEFEKVLFAQPKPDALVYLIKNKSHKIIHLTVVSFNKLRSFCAANWIRSVEDARKFPEVFEVVDNSTENPFIAININAIPGIILCQN